MAVYGGPKIPTDGLILYLDAANIKSYPGSGNTWFNIGGTGLNGSKAGSQSPTYPQWNPLGYFTFIGGTTGNNYSRFDVSNIPLLSGITIDIFSYSENGGALIRASNSDYEISAGSYAAGTNYNDINVTKVDVRNNWIHDSLTFDGSGLVGYRNGRQAATKVRASGTTMAASTARIGTRDDAYLDHLVGNIACLKIYNRALSSGEVLQNYNALKGRFGL
jgi:hypothetical protein